MSLSLSRLSIIYFMDDTCCFLLFSWTFKSSLAENMLVVSLDAFSSWSPRAVTCSVNVLICWRRSLLIAESEFMSSLNLLCLFSSSLYNFDPTMFLSGKLDLEPARSRFSILAYNLPWFMVLTRFEISKLSSMYTSSVSQIYRLMFMFCCLYGCYGEMLAPRTCDMMLGACYDSSWFVSAKLCSGWWWNPFIRFAFSMESSSVP